MSGMSNTVIICCRVSEIFKCSQRGKGNNMHMGTFPEGQHYLSAAGENRDVEPLWRGLYLTDRILLCIDQ